MAGNIIFASSASPTPPSAKPTGRWAQTVNRGKQIYFVWGLAQLYWQANEIKNSNLPEEDKARLLAALYAGRLNPARGIRFDAAGSKVGTSEERLAGYLEDISDGPDSVVTTPPMWVRDP